MEEYLIATNGGETPWSIYIWNVKAGSTVATYRKGICKENSFCFVNNEYFVGGENNFIKVWKLSQEAPMQTIFVRSVINCIDVSFNGKFIAVCISENITIYELSTGCQVCILSGHFLPIKKVLFSGDCSFIISIGSDPFGILWTLKNANIESHQINELVRLNGHSAAINDVFISCGGFCAEIYTVSDDRSCIIWNTNGKILKRIVCENLLQTISVDIQKGFLYMGDTKGNIVIYQKSGILKYVNCSNTEIKCIAISMDSSFLAISNENKVIKIFDCKKDELNCIKIHNLSGNATNIAFKLMPNGLSTKNITEPKLPITKSMKLNRENQDVLTLINC